MALLAVEVPEHRRVVVIGIWVEADLLGPAFEDRGVLGLRAARHGDARKVALDVGEEDGDALRRELLGDGLERDGLAGAGRPGDEAVAVAVPGQQFDVAGLRRGDGLADEDGVHAQGSVNVVGILAAAGCLRSRAAATLLFSQGRRAQ